MEEFGGGGGRRFDARFVLTKRGDDVRVLGDLHRPGLLPQDRRNCSRNTRDEFTNLGEAVHNSRWKQQDQTDTRTREAPTAGLFQSGGA